MKDQIQHIGTIYKTDGSHIQVKIMQASACSTCSAAKLCQSSETKEKIVDVYGDYPRLAVGDNVMVVGTVHQGLHATVWCYIVPLILLLLTLVLAEQCLHSDGLAALASLGILVPYYFALYLMKDRLARKFTFKIKQ